MNNRQYNEYIENRSKRSPCVMNALKAFLVGGLICLIGEALSEAFVRAGAEKEQALLCASLCLIFLSVICLAPQ